MLANSNPSSSGTVLAIDFFTPNCHGKQQQQLPIFGFGRLW